MKLLGLFLFLLLAGCSSKPVTKEIKTIPVSAVQLIQQDVPIFFESLGTLKSSHIVDIKPLGSGILSEVYFKEGQQLKVGDPLFLIDPESALIKVQEAKSMVAQDQTLVQVAKKKLERYKTLANPDLLSQVEWDGMEADIAIKEATLQMDQAKLAAAMMDLERCRIKSPIKGRAGKLTVHKGNLVSNLSPSLVTISTMDPLCIDFTLTENEISQIHSESIPLEISLLCDPQIKTTGQLIFLDNEIDPHSGMLRAKGIIDNPKQIFWPGQSVRVKLRIAVQSNAMLVPFKAVRTSEQGPYVYVVSKEGLAEIRHLKIGQQVDSYMIIQDGLIEDEWVITDGHLRLTPGVKVLVTKEVED